MRGGDRTERNGNRTHTIIYIDVEHVTWRRSRKVWDVFILRLIRSPDRITFNVGPGKVFQFQSHFWVLPRLLVSYQLCRDRRSRLELVRGGFFADINADYQVPCGDNSKSYPWNLNPYELVLAHQGIALRVSIFVSQTQRLSMKYFAVFNDM